MTLMPAALAFFATGTSASASLAEMMIASGFWATRSSIMRISSSVLATLGPVYRKSIATPRPFNSATASFAPFSVAAKYAAPVNFGIMKIFSAF